MSRITQFVSKIDKNVKINAADVRTAHTAKNVILLIKAWRDLTKMGLKESKETIESLLDFIPPKIDSNGWAIRDESTGNQWNDKTYNQIMQGFTDQSYHPELSKEEFINMISDAVDTMEKFYCKDMIEAVEFMFANIKKNGGLRGIAEKNDKFLDGI